MDGALRSAFLFSGYGSLSSSSINPPMLELTNLLDLTAFCFHLKKFNKMVILFLSDTK